jgi:hypothetical protein
LRKAFSEAVILFIPNLLCAYTWIFLENQFSLDFSKQYLAQKVKLEGVALFASL